MGLLGLLEPADSVPVEAIAAVYIDVTTAEVHAVREVAVPRVSTRRPIEAVVANGVQLTSIVVTQGGQVKVVACVGRGRKGTRYGPAASIAICSPICAVDSGVAVVITFGLQY